MGKTLKVGFRMGPAGRALDRVLAKKVGEIDMAQTVAKSDASLLLRRAMEEAQLSAADLARRLDCDNARVHRLLSGDENLTLNTLAHALLALGYTLDLRAKPSRVKPGPATLSRRPGRRKDGSATTRGTIRSADTYDSAGARVRAKGG